MMRRLDLCLSLAMALTLISSACKKDDFADAPGVEASGTQATPTSEAVAPGTPQERAPSAGPLGPGATLPTDHPPVGPDPSDRAPRPQVPVTAGKSDGGVAASGPLRWSAPEGWQAVGTKPGGMRYAEYVVPGAAGEPASEVSVFYFGPGGGGGVQANIDRWVGQFKQADGSSSKDAAKITERQVNGMKVHLVDVSGDYNAGAAMAGGATKTEHRVLGAIVEAPAGLFFFKMLGTKAAITAQEAAFESLVNSFTPGV